MISYGPNNSENSELYLNFSYLTGHSTVHNLNYHKDYLNP